MIKLTGREKEILEVIEVFGINTSVEDIAQIVGIERKNVSSYLTYLRNKGYNIPLHKKRVVKPAIKKAVDESWLAKYEGKWAN